MAPMEKIMITALAISVAFVIVKYIEHRVFYKPPPADEPDAAAAAPPSLKPIFRDAILIFICSVGSLFLIDQLTPAAMTLMGGVATGEILDIGTPKIFTDAPAF